MVAPPCSLVTIIYSLWLGLQPEVAARGLYLLPKLLAGCIDGHLLSIQTNEAVPSHWLRTGVNSTFPWVTAWIQLIATQVSMIPADLSTSLGSQPTIRGGYSLDRTGREINEPRLQVLGAVASHWLGGQSAASTTDAAFLGIIMSPLAAATLRGTARGTVPFLLLETKGKCKEWLSNWSTSGWTIQYRESQGWTTGPWVLEWCLWGHPPLVAWWQWAFHSHVCEAHTRLGWCREEPKKDPHWVSLV